MDKEAIVSVEILGNGISQIVPRCFLSCKNLTDIVIASSVQIIGYDCFRGCKNLKNMTISKKLWDKTCGNTEQEKRSWLGLKDDVKIKTLVSVCIKFFANQEERYTEEESVFTLKRSSNSYREAIVSVEILGNGINEIGDFGFASYLNLANVSIPKSVTTLGCDCFYDCKELEYITLAITLWDKISEDEDSEKGAYLGLENFVYIEREKYETVYKFHVMRPLTLFRMCLREIKKVQQ